jgi:hypothetical protein
MVTSTSLHLIEIAVAAFVRDAESRSRVLVQVFEQRTPAHP